MKLPWWKVRLQTLAIALLLSSAVNGTLFVWLRTDGLAQFIFCDKARIVLYIMNDTLHKFVLSNSLHRRFDAIIHDFSIEDLTDFVDSNWIYANDGWLDIADHPLVAFAEMEGDCDDYARLIAYISGRKDYESYFVALGLLDSGHAIAVYHNGSQWVLADVNGEWQIVEDNVSSHEAIKKLVLTVYPEVRYVVIRDWSLSSPHYIGVYDE